MSDATNAPHRYRYECMSPDRCRGEWRDSIERARADLAQHLAKNPTHFGIINVDRSAAPTNGR